MIVGLTISTTPETSIAPCWRPPPSVPGFIIEAFRSSGVPVEKFVVAGGLARNALLMQIYADVIRLPISIIDSDQGPALGSAIHAAVAAGAYPDVPTAAKAIGKVRDAVYQPDESRAQGYDALFAEYLELHDHFGHATKAMRRLRTIRRAARASRETA